jgi:signal transduction histidine kinase/HAMP domain-containing protein
MIKEAWRNLIKSVTEFDYSTLKNFGIGKMLLVWFLAIALIPLATLSFINFLYYYQGLNIMAKKSLFTTSQLRMNYISSYFQEMNDYLEDVSRDQSTIGLLESLQRDFAKSTGPRGNYMLSEQYVTLARDLRTEIQKTYIPEGINNIYFINTGGKILFELDEGDDIGADLFTGKLATTQFGKTMKTILSSGRPGFSDLEYYPPANNELLGFLGQPVYGAKGEKLGVVALQISTEKIDKIIQYGIGFGNTGHVYVVGLDLKLRSASKIGDKSRILKATESNEKTRQWRGVKVNNITLAADGSPIIEEVSIYKNTAGVVVMGLYRNIAILEQLGVDWAIVEEIDQDEAHAVARELSSFAKISLILTAITVFLLSIYVTRRFVTPIKKISEWAKQVAHGELISRNIRVANNEVGEMKDTFNWLVKSLQSFAEVSQSVALGDYSKSVTVRSDKDVMAKSMNEMVESFKNVVKQAKAIASGDYSTNVMPRSDKDTLGIALYEMTMRLREASIEIMNQDWLKTGINELGQKISGEKSISDLSETVVRFLARYLNAQLGLLYLRGDGDLLHLEATFAADNDAQIRKTLSPGEGLIGQVARERKSLMFFSSEVKGPMVNIGPDSVQPQHFIISPILYEGQLVGVIELGSFEPFDEQKQNFIAVSLDTISVAINTAGSRERVQQLLSTTQEQAKELVMQKEELRQINQELEEQTKALRLSEENLQHQQEELRVINEELEERTRALELQRDDIRKKNEALEQAQLEIRQKAEALEIASRYKSEFLANMSHELRTPLNSILVLSELLATNKNEGMTPEEIEFAGVINASGKDLLDLINDILDLSKVEAGKLQLDIEEMNLDELQELILKSFSPITNKKGIKLIAEKSEDVPESIMTDSQRALQIVKNLASNAIKFTEKGSVTLRIYRPGKEVRFNNPALSPDHTIAIEVADTGIGIPKDKLLVIFEAFQQADGNINRKFGGTGLGLTISRSLSRLLGGEIQLKSTLGEGSVFTLYLPAPVSSENPMTVKSESLPKTTELKVTAGPEVFHEVMNDYSSPVGTHATGSLPSSFQPDTIFRNKKILIVDDDMRNVFALSKILEEKMAQIIVGRNGREGIDKLMQNPDTNLVLMDIMMPEIDGYTAMREIRKDSRFQALPIIALTAKAMKGDREKCIEAGANDYLSKPVQTEKLLTLLRVWLQR